MNILIGVMLYILTGLITPGQATAQPTPIVAGSEAEKMYDCLQVKLVDVIKEC